MKKVVITGGTGFIGANLARRLLRDGYEVHLLLRPGYKAWRISSIYDSLCIHEVNLEDEEGLTRVVKIIKPDWIFHLAVYGAYSYQADLQQMIQTNIGGTTALLNACLKIGFEVFVNTGSSSEYGFKAYPPDEEAWLEPNSYYAVTKASSTLFCRYISQKAKADVVTLRLYSVYGPYEEPTRLMPSLIMHGLKGILPHLVNPSISRDFVYVDDVIEAYILAAARGRKENGIVYNVGSGIQTSLEGAVEVARKVLSIKQEPEWGSMPNRQWDTDTWVANNRRIRNELGWQPRYNFEQGFRKMVDWFLNDPEIQNIYWKSYHGK